MAYSAKRRFQRSPQREAVKIRTPHGVEYAVFDDLSAGGMKIWIDNPKDIGSLMQLEFSIRNPEGRIIHIRNSAIVARCVKAKIESSDGFEIGVQFRESLSAELFSRASKTDAVDSETGPF
jgi:hypothetical protein